MGLYKKLPSPYWHASFKLPGRKQFRWPTKVPIMLEGRKSKANEKLALDEYHRVRAEHLANKHLNIPKKILLKDLTELWLTTKSPEDCNVENYRSTLKPILEYFKGRFAQEITKEEIERYRVWRREPNKDGISISKSTVNKEMAYLGASYNKGIEWERILKNPCVGTNGKGKKGILMYNVKELERTRYLSSQEKSILLSHTRQSCFTILDSLVRFALMTGMRRGEILNLKWLSIDPSRGIITVEESKSGSKRWLTVNNDIHELLTCQPRVSEYVFTWNDERVKEDSLCHAYIRCVNETGLKDVTFHTLRHTFASDRLAEGATMSELQKLLGHATQLMTQRYAHLSKEMLTAVMMRATPLPKYPVFIPAETTITVEMNQKVGI